MYTIVFAEGCKLLQAAALGNAGNVQMLLRARPENIYFRDYDRRTGERQKSILLIDTGDALY